MVFLTWGQHILPELLDTTLDGCLEYVVEDAFYDLYKVLPRTDCLDRIEFLKQKQDFWRKKWPRAGRIDQCELGLPTQESVDGQSNRCRLAMKHRQIGWQRLDRCNGESCLRTPRFRSTDQYKGELTF
jgi:hypothetical protein